MLVTKAMIKKMLMVELKIETSSNKQKILAMIIDRVASWNSMDAKRVATSVTDTSRRSIAFYLLWGYSTVVSGCSEYGTE